MGPQPQSMQRAQTSSLMHITQLFSSSPPPVIVFFFFHFSSKIASVPSPLLFLFHMLQMFYQRQVISPMAARWLQGLQRATGLSRGVQWTLKRRNKQSLT